MQHPSQGQQWVNSKESQGSRKVETLRESRADEILQVSLQFTSYIQSLLLCLHLLSLPPLSIFLPWARTSLLTGKMESISADFDVKASSKPYEINLEEQKDIKGRTLSWRSGHLSCFPDHWQVLSLHLFESTLSINWVVGLDGSCWLKILHYFIFGMISGPGGDKRNWRQEVWFGLIKLNQVDDFPAPILFFDKAAFKCMAFPWGDKHLKRESLHIGIQTSPYQWCPRRTSRWQSRKVERRINSETLMWK